MDLETTLKQLDTRLRAVPRAERHGHWQMAHRAYENAKLLATRNADVAWLNVATCKQHLEYARG